MKKVISLFIAAILLATSFIPAQAARDEEEEYYPITIFLLPDLGIRINRAIPVPPVECFYSATYDRVSLFSLDYFGNVSYWLMDNSTSQVTSGTTSVGFLSPGYIPVPGSVGSSYTLEIELSNGEVYQGVFAVMQ